MSDRMGVRGGEPDPAASEIAQLARRWPRELIQTGEADDLASRWIASREVARSAGRSAYAGGPLTPALATALFESRRARRLVRGLEEIEKALDAQAQGLRAAPARASAGSPDRISRLLVVSEDGSDRFFREISKLIREHGAMLETYVCACDEQALGAAVFGEGSRARALLVDHKEAVVQVLRAIAGDDGVGAFERKE